MSVLGLGFGIYLLLNRRWWDVAVVALLVAIYGAVRLVTSWRRRSVEEASQARTNDRANASYHFLKRKRLSRQESNFQPRSDEVRSRT
jgi:hypothetical protein